MKMDVRKFASYWYVVEVKTDGTVRPIASFKTKKSAMQAMEAYKTRDWAKA